MLTEVEAGPVLSLYDVYDLSEVLYIFINLLFDSHPWMHNWS